MAQNVKRVAAAIAALLGLALTIGGVWLATRVGPSGTATFTGKPTASGAVLLTPTVLNRLDADVTVTANAVPGGTTWLGVTTPSDAEAILGTSPKIAAVGFDKSEFALLLEASGQGDLPAIAGADIWRERAEGTGSASVTLSQEDAPQSVVITTDKQRLASVTVTVERKAWFVQAMVALVMGLTLLVGALLLWRSSRRPAAPRPQRPTPAVPAAPEAPAVPRPETSTNDTGVADADGESTAYPYGKTTDAKEEQR